MSRHNVKIETLSYIHVGEGLSLQNNCDFIVDGDALFIINPEALGRIIGTDKLTIDKWIAAIENKDIKSFLDFFTHGKDKEDYSSRTIDNFAGNIKPDSTLATCMHDGRGFPYIPGSSIKGAIRTAVTAILMEKELENKKFLPFDEAKHKLNKLFNNNDRNNPQFDVFRFITVGDAFFESGSEVAIRLVLLNQRGGDNLLDKAKAPQVAEVIDTKCFSSFIININKEKYNTVAQRANITQLPEEISSISSLFKCINNYTKKMIDDEIDYWNDFVNEESKVGAENYIENMVEIKDIVEQCREGKECVIRLGQGIGWRFITGAWAEKLENFYQDYVPKIRYNYRHYEAYDFPKSRRIDDESYLLGFVKLTIDG